jgi:hypothetical protein
MAWAAVTGPIPGRPDQSRNHVVDGDVELGAVGFQRPGCLSQRRRQAADLALPHRQGPAGVSRLPPAGQPGQHRFAEVGTGQVTVVVVAVAQQGPQPVGLAGGRAG